jgi:hypothetical protein
MTEKELDTWFERKPDTYQPFREVRKLIERDYAYGTR